MANQEQLAILKQGVMVWNMWRKENLTTRIDLDDADLTGADLMRADFNRANLIKTNLSGANLLGSDLREANLSKATLIGAYLRDAKLSNANLSEAFIRDADLSEASLANANLKEAILWDTDLSEANLTSADLRGADLMDANFRDATLTNADLTGTDLSGATLVGAWIDKVKVSGSAVYGINVWDLHGEFDEQKDLIITQLGDPAITVDNIRISQFIYLILNNEEIRVVMNTLTSKAVLILGRFSIPERKAILAELKNKLREYNLLPIVFNFDRPTDKDFTETIKTLAGLCYFVIADITNPRSSPLELQATVPDYQIPFVPIIQEGEQPFTMMVDLQKKYPWVLDTLTYKSINELIKALKPAIIDPAIQKHNELRLIKAQEPKIRSASDFIDDKGLDNPSGSAQ